MGGVNWDHMDTVDIDSVIEYVMESIRLQNGRMLHMFRMDEFRPLWMLPGGSLSGSMNASVAQVSRRGTWR